MKTSAGFTLLEVLVAVAILALAMAAIIGGAATYASNTGYLREKTLALWVAHNRLTEIMLAAQPPALGNSDNDVDMGGIQWTWRAEVKETPDPNLHRVDIRVEKKDEQVRGGGKKPSYAALSAFVPAKL